jgi:hypothetical protein
VRFEGGTKRDLKAGFGGGTKWEKVGFEGEIKWDLKTGQ